MKSSIKLGISLFSVIFGIIFLSACVTESQDIPSSQKDLASDILLGSCLVQRGPQSKWTDKTLTEAFQKVKEGGFRVAIWTEKWGSIEPSLGNYQWGLLDYTTEKTRKQGFKFSLSIEIAQVADNPSYPKEIQFKSFVAPDFIDNFKKFTKALVKRYKGKIDYLWIGQEVDYYIVTHPEQKAPFIKFFNEFEKEVKSIDPSIKVGVVGGYHLSREYDNMAILQELSKLGDLIALTVYPEGSRYAKNPEDAYDYFGELVSSFPNRKIAIHETAWSSGGKDGSPNKQVEYIKQLSKVIVKHKERFEFFSWYILHDFSKEDNRASVADYSSLAGVGNKEYLDWHGSLGLLNSNGREKSAWHAWKDFIVKGKPALLASEEQPQRIKPNVLLGVFLTQKGSMSQWTGTTLTEAFQRAKEGRIDVAIWTGSWRSIEPSSGKYSWDFLDYVTAVTSGNGMKCSLNLEIVNGTDNGAYPEGVRFTSFDDPAFINSFKSFTEKLLTRYKGKIDFLWIGHEVNSYLESHPDQKTPFLNFFQKIKQEMKSNVPGVKIGITGSYKMGRTKLLQELAEMSDVIGLSVHMEHEETNPELSDTGKYFDELVNHFTNSKIVIYATAWSSRGPKGSDQKQSEYIKRVAEALKKHENRFEFFSWHMLHDFSKADTYNFLAAAGLKDNQYLKWYGSLGLLNNDGSEKAAWRVWQEHLTKDK